MANQEGPRTSTVGSALGTAAQVPVTGISWRNVLDKPPGVTGSYVDLADKPTIPANLADLGGVLPVSALPPIAIQDWLGLVSSQSAMLALVGQRGDWCTRGDRGTDWRLVGDDSTNVTSWREDAVGSLITSLLRRITDLETKVYSGIPFGSASFGYAPFGGSTK